jgi:hypothetical protein
MPRGFARDIMGGRTHNIQASLTNAKPTQHGVYDLNILCAKCDGVLGYYDDYAIEVCRRFKSDHVVQGDMFSVLNVDGDKLAKFVLAVLWRASISSRPEFKKIALGPYEDLARDVLFGAKALSEIRAFEVIVSRFREIDNFDVEGVYTSPSSVSNLGVNGWGFAVSGFRIVAKMDQRPWPRMPADGVKQFVVNGNDKLNGLFVNFNNSVEHRATLAMAKAHRTRQQKPKNRT